MKNNLELAKLVQENLNQIFNAVRNGEIPPALIPNDTMNALLQEKDRLRLSARQGFSRS